ncbi:thiol reductant ABC exporter subunit CydC [Desulfotomaculum defluvii]
MSTIRQLVLLVLPHWQLMLMAVLLGFLTVGSNIGLLTTSAYLISRAALHPPILDLMVAIVGVRFFGLARAIFRYFERYFSHDVTFRVLCSIRVWFYRNIEPLAPSSLKDYHSGDLLSRIVTDVETLKNFYLRVLAPPLVALMTLIVSFYFLSYYDIRMSFLLMLFFLIAGLIAPILIGRWSCPLGEEIVESKSKLNSLLVGSIQGMADIEACGQQSRQLGKVAKETEKLLKLQGSVAKINGLASSLTGLCMHLTMWGILVLAIMKVEQGELAGVNIAMLSLVALSCFEAVTPLPMIFPFLQESMAAASRLFAITAQGAAKSDNKDEIILPQGYQIDFSQLCFRYDLDSPWVLQDISFTVPQGGKVAVVGPSGAGKSTLIGLLLGFYDYQGGSIKLGGREITDYKQNKLVEQMAVVSQRTHLFNTTIRENLLLARPDAGQEDMINAAQKAKIHDFIMSLPLGYDTYVGEGGFKLSGGQRQRLAIARAILKNAPILILDELATGIDPVAEQEIMQDLYQLMKEKTTLIITHNLVGLERMDQIIVLAEGNVVERGNHQQLLAQRGLYQRLFMAVRR